MSFKVEVIADDSGKWAGNALRFKTRKEALAYASDLYSRWTLVRETRTKRVSDPVNAFWDDKSWRAISLEVALA